MKKENNVVEIEVYRGCVTNVRNLPLGWRYKIVDHDTNMSEVFE